MEKFRIKKSITTDALGKSKEEYWVQIKKWWWFWRDCPSFYAHDFGYESYCIEFRVIKFPHYKPCKRYLENHLKKSPEIIYLGCTIMPAYTKHLKIIYFNLKNNLNPNNPHLMDYEYSSDLEELKERIAKRTKTTKEYVIAQ